MSPLKEVTVPLTRRNEKTLLEPLEPEYKSLERSTLEFVTRPISASDPPRVTSNGEVGRNRDCSIRVVMVRDRSGVEISEPEHDLVHGGTANSVGGEQIIGNVSRDCSVTLGPVPR